MLMMYNVLGLSDNDTAYVKVRCVKLTLPFFLFFKNLTLYREWVQFTGIRETQESTRIGEKSLRLVIDRRTKLHTHVNTRAVRNEAAALTVPKSCQKAAGGFNLAFLFYFIYIYFFSRILVSLVHRCFHLSLYPV